MKRKVFIPLCLIITIMACNKNKDEQLVETKNTSTTTKNNESSKRYASGGTDTFTHSAFITMDVANQMINSYLYSISTDTNNTPQTPDLNAFSIDADSLRAYLANPQVTHIKIMFAHTMRYINAGNYGVPAGYQVGALTIVIAAYDTSGNYVYYSPGGQNELNGLSTATTVQIGAQGTNYVLDHCLPCPYSCPPGTAGSAILQ